MRKQASTSPYLTLFLPSNQRKPFSQTEVQDVKRDFLRGAKAVVLVSV
jgi:hypothetical protein